MAERRLVKKVLFSGSIKVLTGLHIGGTNSSISIGGIDKEVIRDPLTKKPLIPGTSLKGKMRSLIEVRDKSYNATANMGAVKNGPSNENQVDSKGQPALSSRLFGMAARDNSKNIPSRLIVRDAHLLTPESFFKDTAMLYTEAKTEVVIDRVTSAAMPRQMERIPVGSEFKLNLVLTLYTNDDEKEYVNGIFDALKLIEDDYLGGSGSRGYGQVKFTIENLTERDVKYYQSLGEERPFTAVPIPEQFKTKA